MGFDNSKPLAVRMRPRTLEEFVGQSHIVGKGRLLYRCIKADRLTSMIFYGPSGTGKTTLAKVIAGETKYPFAQLNAVSCGVKDIRALAEKTVNVFENPKQRCILFLDEIHRLNKAQQDSLLPYVEDGTFILIGATTENPYFEVNRALLSRSTVYEFKTLTENEVRIVLNQALNDNVRGFGGQNIRITDEALQYLAEMSGGDARVALNALELGVLTSEPDSEGCIHIDAGTAQECLQRRAIHYDKDGDNHYDVISAFIKSMRNYMEPDAVLHYLARMIEAGEQPEFIARRIMIAAAEDVGLANPMALVVATAACQAVERVGWPEGAIILSEAALMVACSPKSNSVLGVQTAMEDVRSGNIGEVPAHLRDAHYQGHEELGRGIGYLYSHNYPNGRAPENFMPEALRGKRYYYPKAAGSEEKILNNLTKILGYDAGKNNEG